MEQADFLVIGGGIAGLSAAASLAPHGRTIAIEGEAALGSHSSGRSVAFSHYGIGNRAVRALTAWSRPFFEAPPAGFSPSPIARLFPSLYFAGEDDLERLAAIEAGMADSTNAARRVGEDEMKRLCPLLRTGAGAAIAGLLDPTGLKLDAEAMLQGYARAVRAGRGAVLTGRRVARIEARDMGWRVEAENGDRFAAPVLVNAAGAWADRIAALAGVRPIGLQPKRRTIIVVDPGEEVAAWPFVHAVAGDFYMLPEAGRLLVSPVDEIEDDPGDAQPEDYDVALAADRLEHHTRIKVERIRHRWAGLRSFVPDRTPTAGFDAQAPGFFWLAGQGGYGLQTAPAMAAIVASLVTGTSWPAGLAELGATPDLIGPDRLARSTLES
jgi:D-arginine dehydrogenase